MADPVTRHCCGPMDCRVLAEGEAMQTAAGWTVNGKPVANVYPTSAEGGSQYWACFKPPALVDPNCLFLPLGF